MNEFISRKHVILIFSIFKKKKKIFLVNAWQIASN